MQVIIKKKKKVWYDFDERPYCVGDISINIDLLNSVRGICYFDLFVYIHAASQRAQFQFSIQIRFLVWLSTMTF